MERNELVRYLDRVKSSYPYGVPKAALERAAQDALLANQPLCRVLFVIGSVEGTLSAAESELMESIVEKGLSLPRSACEVHVMCLGDGSPTLESVREVIALKRPEIAIALGLGLKPRGEWTTCADVPLLHTVLLAEISSSKEAKREFWGHLKSVLAKLAP
jgi:hypothetical protein